MPAFEHTVEHAIEPVFDAPGEITIVVRNRLPLLAHHKRGRLRLDCHYNIKASVLRTRITERRPEPLLHRGDLVFTTGEHRNDPISHSCITSCDRASVRSVPLRRNTSPQDVAVADRVF